MTNQDLADWLNAELGLTGKTAVTRDVVRQWVFWGLLPKAVGRGRSIGQSREWNRDESSLAIGRRLGALREWGLRSESGLVSQLWLEGYPIEFVPAKKALIAEFEAARKRILRRVTTDFDPRSDPAPSAAKQKAVENQMGKLAPVLQEMPFTLSTREKVAVYGAARFGADAGLDPNQFLRHVIQELFESAGAKFDAQVRITGVTGFLGDPTEIVDSARDSLNCADQAEFELARRYWSLTCRTWLLMAKPQFWGLIKIIFPNFPDLMTFYDAVKNEVFVGPWAIMEFCRHLHLLYIGEEWQNESLEFLTLQEAELNSIDEFLAIGELDQIAQAFHR